MNVKHTSWTGCYKRLITYIMRIVIMCANIIGPVSNTNAEFHSLTAAYTEDTQNAESKVVPHMLTDGVKSNLIYPYITQNLQNH